MLWRDYNISMPSVKFFRTQILDFTCLIKTANTSRLYCGEQIYRVSVLAINQFSLRFIFPLTAKRGRTMGAAVPRSKTEKNGELWLIAC
jgi:hypothetical protein